MLSRGAEFIGLIILPGVLSRVSDPMSGYFMLRRSAIAYPSSLDPLGYKILIEVVARGRMRWIGRGRLRLPVSAEGESKVTWRLQHEYVVIYWSCVGATCRSPRLSWFCVVERQRRAVDMSLLYVLSDPSMSASA